MRKGVIEPSDPSQITWSTFVLDYSIQAYRAGAFKEFGNHLFWIGGSDDTYNYDGLSYDSGQGVEPSNRLLYYDGDNNAFQEFFYDGIPMDLRGVAHVSDTVNYLAGGMEAGQVVSNKTLKLNSFPLLVKNKNLVDQNFEISLFPNPASEMIFIDLKNVEDCSDVEIKMYDLSGRVVNQIVLKSCDFEIDVSDLSVGIYNLSAKIEDQQVVKEFIKN